MILLIAILVVWVVAAILSVPSGPPDNIGELSDLDLRRKIDA